jgi:hypothetical protein
MCFDGFDATEPGFLERFNNSDLFLIDCSDLPAIDGKAALAEHEYIIRHVADRGDLFGRNAKTL